MSAATSATTGGRPPGSFQKRIIEVTIKKSDGVFTTTGKNTVTLSGLRCSASISMAGGQSQGTLDLKVFGMAETMMNDLSFAGAYLKSVGEGGDIVTVMAGTEAEGLGLVYSGPIKFALADYSTAPLVPFHITSLTAYAAALMSVPPSSYRGSADAAVVMSNLARLMGYTFENNGVVGVHISNPYLHGSPYDQAMDCARMGGFNATVASNTLIIWPKGQPRAGVIPLITPTSGLVGYPVKTPIGVNFRMLYSSSIKAFGAVQLESSLKFCSGLWVILTMNHQLDSMTPSGAWFTDVTCQSPLMYATPGNPPAASTAPFVDEGLS